MLLHQTSIDIFNHKEGIAINAALLGQSETENEASHDLFRDGIMELERFLKIPTEKSWLCSVNEADSGEVCSVIYRSQNSVIYILFFL